MITNTLTHLLSSFQNQSVFRIYRFGQSKTCFIYRFIAYGTMKQKIYERQTVKIATAKRVLDRQKIDSHFTSQQLFSLYSIKNIKPKQPRSTFAPPEDNLLSNMLKKHDFIYKYHIHEDLLTNRSDLQLECPTSIVNESKDDDSPVNDRLKDALVATNDSGTPENEIGTIYGIKTSILFELLSKKVLEQNPQAGHSDRSKFIPLLVARLHAEMHNNDQTVCSHEFFI